MQAEGGDKDAGKTSQYDVSIDGAQEVVGMPSPGLLSDGVVR